jgi:hypothetical protein
MTAMSDALTEFVTDRIDEDEAAASEVHEPRICSSVDRDGDFEPGKCDCGHPARVLREVEAKRARLRRRQEQAGCDLPEGVHEGRDPGERDRDEALKDALETEVREDAAVWSDHPYYDPAWSRE